MNGCLYCQKPVEGAHPLGTPCPHCKKQLILITLPTVQTVEDNA